jgi:hypothetical protein
MPALLSALRLLQSYRRCCSLLRSGAYLFLDRSPTPTYPGGLAEFGGGGVGGQNCKSLGRAALARNVTIHKVRREIMSDLVFNERVKYAATFFNNIGVASIAVGVVLPMLSAAPVAQGTFFIGYVAFGFFCVGAAQSMLGMLKG